MRRSDEVGKVTCLVRAGDPAKGLSRLQQSGHDRGVWDDDWVSSGRIEVVTGDLDSPHFGFDHATWTRLAASVDVIYHNGALVS